MNRASTLCGHGFARKTVTALLALSLCAPVLGQADDYSQMLKLLNANRIDGQVGAGATGNLGINSAAGLLNLQSNQRVIVSGCGSLASVQAQNLANMRPQNLSAPGAGNLADTGQVAQTEIAGQAFSHASGFLGINQVSGAGNAQLNAITVGGLSGQSLSEIRATGGSATSAQLPNSTGGSGSQSTKEGSADHLSATIGDGAFSGFGGVLQINQVSGVGNVTANHFSISIP